MAVTPTGGVTGGGAAGGDIALDFEDLRAIGEHTSSTAAEARTAGSAISATRGEHGRYSSYPVAQQLAAHHDAVADVFTQTLQALSQEMEEFGVALKQCATNYADADDGIQAALASVCSRLTSGNATTAAYDSARAEAGNRLVREDDAALDDATVATATADAEASQWDILSDGLETATAEAPGAEAASSADEVVAASDSSTSGPTTALE